MGVSLGRTSRKQNTNENLRGGWSGIQAGRMKKYSLLTGSKWKVGLPEWTKQDRSIDS